MVEVICEASVSQLSKLKKVAERAPPLPLRSQDGARLGRVVSIVSHCIFWPFAVRNPGTFSALKSAGSVSLNALRPERCSSVTQVCGTGRGLSFKQCPRMEYRGQLVVVEDLPSGRRGGCERQWELLCQTLSSRRTRPAPRAVAWSDR